MTGRNFVRTTLSVGDNVADFMLEYEIKAPTLAKMLGIPRSRLQRLLEGARCDGDMALRLSRVFPPTSPQYWMNMQSTHDISFAQATLGDAIIKETTPLEAPAS